MGEVYDIPDIGDTCQVIAGLYKGAIGKVVKTEDIDGERAVKVLIFGESNEPSQDGGHWLWAHEVKAFVTLNSNGDNR